MYQLMADGKSFACYGVFATVNGLNDPQGFLGPVTIQCSALIRQLSMQADDWHSLLPDAIVA